VVRGTVVRQQVASKAMGRSADRITRLRDADGDGRAEQRDVFLENLPGGPATRSSPRSATAGAR
jgi:hypothetical protein